MTCLLVPPPGHFRTTPWDIACVSAAQRCGSFLKLHWGPALDSRSAPFSLSGPNSFVSPSHAGVMEGTAFCSALW